MRILSALIPLAAFGGIASASALTSQPHNPQSHQQLTSGVEPVARRVVAPHRYHYRGQNRGHIREPRQFVSPPTTAAPMPRVPQVAPLAPRIGN
jgi:hypothetical protein